MFAGERFAFHLSRPTLTIGFHVSQKSSDVISRRVIRFALLMPQSGDQAINLKFQQLDSVLRPPFAYLNQNSFVAREFA
jgi:hypothetical protein